MWYIDNELNCMRKSIFAIGTYRPWKIWFRITIYNYNSEKLSKNYFISWVVCSLPHCKLTPACCVSIDLRFWLWRHNTIGTLIDSILSGIKSHLNLTGCQHVLLAKYNWIERATAWEMVVSLLVCECWCNGNKNEVMYKYKRTMCGHRDRRRVVLAKSTNWININ